jgi:hypothetical protein
MRGRPFPGAALTRASGSGGALAAVTVCRGALAGGADAVAILSRGDRLRVRSGAQGPAGVREAAIRLGHPLEFSSTEPLARLGDGRTCYSPFTDCPVSVSPSPSLLGRNRVTSLLTRYAVKSSVKSFQPRGVGFRADGIRGIFEANHSGGGPGMPSDSVQK